MAGMKISTSKSRGHCSQLECSFWARNTLLPYVEKFKYPRVSFTSKGRVEFDRWIGEAPAVVKTLYWLVVVMT